jgi:uncharacterized membrane protein YdjX (TVP38/TMEM64 family)
MHTGMTLPTEQTDRRKRSSPRTIVFAGVILILTVLHYTGVLKWHQFMEMGEAFAHQWWFPFLIVGAKILLYTFALPGSLLIWLVAAVYEPVAATLIIAIGGVAGACSAFYVVQHMTLTITHTITLSPFFRLLSRHSDFLTLSAARLLPNFPHSVINYGSGILRVSPLPFIASTVIGFTAKGYLYALAIRRAATADDVSDLISFETTIPLFILTALLIIGKMMHLRLKKH